MKPENIMILVLSGILTVSMGILIYLDMFEMTLFVGCIVILLDYAVIYLYLHLSKKRDEATANEKDKFPYCWRRMNDMLTSMAGGDKLEWWGGHGRQSQVRVFYDGNKRRKFRSMYGFLTRKKQSVLVIWDIDNEDIVGYWPNPSAIKLSDPFDGFDPFHVQPQLGMQLKRGRRGKYGRGGLTIHYGGGQGEDEGGPEPDDDFVRRGMPDNDDR